MEETVRGWSAPSWSSGLPGGYGSAAFRSTPSPADRTINDELILAAELVSLEACNQYIAIRVTVPQSSLAAINRSRQAMGHVISRHRANCPQCLERLRFRNRWRFCQRKSRRLTVVNRENALAVRVRLVLYQSGVANTVNWFTAMDSRTQC